MTSPWAAPFLAAFPKPAKPAPAHVKPEPFAAQAGIEVLDGLLTETLLPFLDERIVRDRRLEQRGVADIVERTLTGRLVEAAGRKGLTATPAKTKRSMADVHFQIEGADISLDVKSRNVGASFSMPNLISIDRLDTYYRKGSNVFVLLMAEYEEEEDEILFKDIRWMRAEEICWDCLSIQNLGLGQLQITNAKNRIERFKGDRNEWMRRLRSEAAAFYGRLSEKSRIAQAEWLAKSWTCEEG